MTAELEKLLKSGREKLAEAQRLIDEEAAAEREWLAKLDEQRHNAIMELVPEALHPYVSVENNEYLHIQLPNAARVSARVYLRETIMDERVSVFLKAELYEWRPRTPVWRVFRYYAHEGEVNWFGEDGQLYNELDTALACAVELGDRKSVAELDAEHQRSQWAACDGGNDEATDEMDLICPLISAPDKRQICLRHECAWFVVHNGMDACSLKVLAYGLGVE